MAFSYTMRLGLLVLTMGIIAVGQTESPSPQSGDTASQQSSESAPQETGETPSDQRTVPAPAFGQNAPILSPENPPISGIDEPKLDLRRALRSFISGGLVAAETADSNPTNQLGSTSGVKSVSHVLGALDLQRYWAKSDLLAEYLGGGSFYTSGVNDIRQIQAIGLMGVTRWRTGQIALHETFDYLPEGSFGGGGGGSPGLGIAQGGGVGIPGGSLPGSHMFGGSQASGGIGLVSRISDLSIVDVTQSLSPRTAVTLVGGYGMSHYLEHQDQYFNSQQITAEVGYSHLLNRRDQIGLVYGFSEFRFPQSETGKIDSQVAFVRWGRTITGRMSLQLGIGPEYVVVYQPGVPLGKTLFVSSAETINWSGAGRAALHYQFPKTSVTASYEKFTSSGSGFYAGADTQLVRVTAARPLWRRSEIGFDVGYSHNHRLNSAALGIGGGQNYQNGFAGATLHRRIGRSWGMFASYHFNELNFDSSLCLGSFGCGHTTTRHAVSMGVDWHFRPVRIE